MAGRMPILSQDDVFEILRQMVDDRNDFIAVRHCEIATWTKIVLYVYDEKHVVGANMDSFIQGRPHFKSFC